jgi:hypothetical protein
MFTICLPKKIVYMFNKRLYKYLSHTSIYKWMNREMLIYLGKKIKKL